MKFCFTLALLLSISLYYCKLSLAQTDAAGKLNNARKLAETQQYEAARELTYQILRNNPNFHDAAVLTGRTLGWQKKYDSARVVLKKVLIQEPHHFDALEALTDLEIWAGDYEKALACADIGIAAWPDKDVFYLKKAKGYIALQQYNDASTLLVKLLHKDPKHTEALQLHQSIKVHTYTKATEVNYIYSTFPDKTEDWHWINVQQTLKFKKHTFNLSLNFADRFNKSALQYEAEAYPVLSKQIYAYIGLAYSQGVIFPKLRSGAELFVTIGKKSEISAGARYLDFRLSKSKVVTASFSQGYRKYLFTIRPFINIADKAAAPAGSFTMKRFLKDNRFNFIALSFNYGFIPDNPAKYAILTQNVIVASEAYPLQSAGIRLDFQHDLYKSLKLKGQISYEDEEFLIDKFRSRFSTGLGLIYVY